MRKIITLSPRLSLVCLMSIVVACSDSSGSGFGDGSSNGGGASSGGSSGFGGNDENTLLVEPRNAVLFIDTATNPATRARQEFKIIRKTASGDKDVTSTAEFILEKPQIGGFNGNTFESVDSLPPDPPGVTSRLTVKADGGSAGANITVVPLRRSSDNRDFFFIVPYNEAPTPANDTLKFKTNIQNVDVSFVMDTTGSMLGPINGLKAAIRGTLLAQLQAAIPSVGLSIVSHQDETDGIQLVSVRQTTTTSLAMAQAGVDTLTLGDGGDFPEGQVPAMYHVLTGGRVGVVPAVTPPMGTKGAVHFRSGAVPVVVLITDATWHDPRGGVTGAMLQSAFTTANAKFVSLSSGNENQANVLSDATKSNLPPAAFAGCAAGQCCTGVRGAARAATGPMNTCRLNFQFSSGNDIGPSVVSAIKAIAVGSVYDVTVRPKNDPTNPNGIDATKFIKALRAKEEGDASQGCPPHPAKDTNGDGVKDTFSQVTVGTPVCFEVIPDTNTTVEPQTEALFPKADLEVLGVPGDVKLDTRKVLFLIPPKAGGTR